MPLPDLAVLKDYLRIETEGEDVALEEMLDRAEAVVRHCIDRPIEDAERTYRIEGDSNRMKSFDRLLHPEPPLDAATVVIENGDGDTIDAATYHVDGDTGIIRGLLGVRFENFPYDITADNGLEHRTGYEVVVEPMLGEAILAYAAMLYHQRNPNASQESTAGVTVTYMGLSMPMRTRDVVQSFRRPL